VSDYDHGPLRTYEITWKSGHIETIQGHQVTFDSHRIHVDSLFGGSVATTSAVEPRFTIHGEIDGHWRLLLTAPEADLLSIRDVTDREAAPEAEVQS
jgi:hypothetical protein